MKMDRWKKNKQKKKKKAKTHDTAVKGQFGII